MNLQKLVDTKVRQYMLEAQERDPYVSVRPGQATYDILNANDLRSMFFDPSRKIGKGEFVTIVYVSEATINKTFKNDGYTDDEGNTMSASDIEQQGRALNKPYLNAFYDSDEFKQKLSKKRGASRPFAVFTTVTQQLNWNSMNYGKKKDEIDALFANASDSDLNDFVANDADFAKRIIKFKDNHPEMADEIDQYISMGSFPRDIINQIRKTRLMDSGKGWNMVDGNDFVSRHDGTGNEALRLTKSSNLKTEYQSYVILQNGEIKRISDEEYFHLVRMFGAKSKKTNNSSVQTSIRKAMNAISNRYEFRDYLIPQIAKMSFTIDGKPVTYKNHELNVGGIIIDADDFLSAPMTENRIRLTESQLHNIIKESIRQVLSSVR